MDKIVTYSLNENFIENLAGFIEKNFLKNSPDISRLAFVFEGKRPALFLKKALSKRIGKSFFSPTFFSIDEFIQYTLSKKTPFIKIANLESWYIIYALARKIAPEVVKGREKFSQFLPWAREIAKFIDLLDLEDIAPDSLKNIQASASIGYEIPENINVLLKNIIILRNAYHKLLSKNKSFSRGFTYLSTARIIQEVSFDEFDKIIFCSFFYMYKTEQKVIKHLYDIDKAILFFQGDEDRWPVLKNTARYFSSSIKPEKKRENNYSLNLYAAFDRHSQVCTVRTILKKIKKLDSTVIILPDPNSMIPLVSEIGSLVGEFNVSLGYPLKRSLLYSLFEIIVQAQKTKKGAEYYTKDYITALNQPLLKNLKILPDYSATRVLVHKIEEVLLGIENTSISGNLFVKLADIENEDALFELAVETLEHMDIKASIEDLQNILKELHLLLFTLWEDITNFHDFALSLGKFLDTLVRKSLIGNYPLNLKIAKRLYNLIDELENISFSRENFIKEDIFKIFQDMLENEIISFSGSPLKGLQVLGMFETRSLNFENVIIMNGNESQLPRLHIYEPLIPHDIIVSLGLDTIEKEEEIQHYLFKRIISVAKNVHLIYEENSEKERSRFIEEIIWQRQKKEKTFTIKPIPQVSFSTEVLLDKREIKKTKEMIEFLKKYTYSISSIDTYLQCPLQFYYKYVLGFEEKAELPEDIEGKEIGTFIHQLLRDTFARFINRKPQINKEFSREFLKMFAEKFKNFSSKRRRPDLFMLEKVLDFRLKRFLTFEQTSKERRVEKILYLEKQFKEKIELSGITFDFTYIVDRVDKLEDGSVLILDYKTGADAPKPQQADKLEKMKFKRESIRDQIRSFQLPLYYYFEKKKYEEETLNAALYNLRSLKLSYLYNKKRNEEKLMQICLNALDFILHEIIDTEKTFMADSANERNCKYCPFFSLCR